jgi:D-sedoheptulose 7-phosphate isomerase
LISKEPELSLTTSELMPAIILAGGPGTRLRPLTEHVPKAMIDVAGQPFLWHQLQLLKRHGIRHVVLAVGYLGERIQQTFGDGATAGVSLEYSYDGPSLLGTAGAIRKALPLLPEQFFVLYGDSYLTCDYQAVEQAFRRSRLPGLMTIYRNDGQFDASNVEFDGNRIVRYDKKNRTPSMRYIDYGLGVFHRSAFMAIAEGEKRDLTDVYQQLLDAGKLEAFEVHERFYEIGSAEGLRETTNLLLESRRMSGFSASFLDEVREIAARLDVECIEKAVNLLAAVRERGGRLFVLGVGGSAANASHAVNDFRKIAGIEAYSPTDNVSELTARINDEGWPSVFAAWLQVSRLDSRDAVLVLSVGGGDPERNVSPNIVTAVDYAKSAGAAVIGIVGRDGGYTAKIADACIIIPVVHSDRITPHTEAFQAVVWHLLVSHPALQRVATHWESISKTAAGSV